MENELEINNNINKEYKLNLYENQKNFLQTDLGKTINLALDIGIKAALPDLIEDQIVDIKNTILEQGFKEGIKDIINSGLEIGKSVMGIATGNFESISQVQLAIKKGGILDSISKLLDTVINFAQRKNLINTSVSKVLKQSKNTIINSMNDKIGETLTNQIKTIEKLDKYCEIWNIHFENKDFSEMEKTYKKIENYLNKVMPLENIINKAKRIENIQNLIKNNGKNFDISNEEMELAGRLI